MNIEQAWETLLQDLNIAEEIAEHKFYKISSTTIKKYYEPRLMAKFDHSVSLPKIFQKHNLSIQPDSNSSYVIAAFDSYKKLPIVSSPVLELQFPSHIESITPEKLTSESTAILCAYHAGIFSNILGDVRADLTVFGRMRTGTFDYKINDITGGFSHSLSVKNSQCEIDAGIESAHDFLIVEAKAQLPQDFLIRQLYYPYRVWAKRLQKNVMPVFLTYANDIFTVHLGRFNDIQSYNSLEFVAHHRFSVVSRGINIGDVEGLWHDAKFLSEPASPFPQADSFLRVLDLMTQMFNAEEPIKQQEVTKLYAFAQRQALYYADAGIYLGFVEKVTLSDKQVTYQLSKLGREIMAMAAHKRNLAIVERVLRFRVFHRALGLYFKQARRPTKQQIIEIMLDVKVKGLGEGKTTIPRRAQTVLTWLDWMLELTRA